MAYEYDDIDSGDIIVPQPDPGVDPEEVTAPLPVDDTTQEQIDEMGTGNNDGVVVGYDNLTEADNNPGVPDYPEETMYRKRIVKVVGGKIVAERIVYMKRISVSASGGYGDGYAFFQPVASSDTLQFHSVEITLN